MSIVSLRPQRIKHRDLVLDGLMRQSANDKQGAMDVYAGILKKQPRHAAAWFLMGTLFDAIKESRRAIDCFTKCLSIKPGWVEAWYNRAYSKQSLGDLVGAKADYEEAIRREPAFAPSFVNLGNIHLAMGDTDAAYRMYDRATDFTLRDAEGVFNQGFVHFLQGDWALGWEKYERRWKLPNHAHANPLPVGVPIWKGEDIRGRRLLILHEQGAGDTFMCLRYMHRLERTGAHLTIRCERAMHRLLSANFPACAMNEWRVAGVANAETTEPFPACDVVIPLMSLPRLYGHGGEVPYLRPPTDGVVTLPATDQVRLGFAWRGSKDHKNDRFRSTKLDDWKGLLALDGIEWVCLQQEMTDHERQTLDRLPWVQMVKARDWADTASVLPQLDGLLSVDTGVVHLAGAMRLPTHVLLAALPDFRWGVERRDTEWYNRFAVMRQRKADVWAPSFNELLLRLTYLPSRLAAVEAQLRRAA